MNQKLNVGILFGGKSTEHEISLLSAQSIINAIDRSKYDLTLIGIDQQGQWYLNESNDCVAIKSNQAKSLTLTPGNASKSLQLAGSQPVLGKIDVMFPILHGIYGEDGSVQGLLKLVDIPFVGAGVLDSAIGMDKDVMKRLLRDAGIQISKFLVFHRYERELIRFSSVQKELGLPLFVKPSNTGSSVGISKVRTEAEFEAAVTLAFKYDHKIVVEEFVPGREIECAVLGNDEPIVSLPGEVVPHHDFYSYEAKYLDDQGATLKVPADLGPALIEQLQQLSIKVFKTLCCHGMARVDYFLRDDGEIFVNEINTIPGFTSISMYPALWEATGLSYSDLLDRLIDLALQQHQQTKQLNTLFLTK